MATDRQIQANRRNAQRSTGPKTLEGKTASSRNALKTGINAKSQIIRGESAAALQALADEYLARWQPATPEERCLIDTLVDSDWLLRRLRRIEAEIWEYELNNAFRPGGDHPIGLVFIRNKDTLMRLQRRIDSTQRNYHRALTELRRLQAEKDTEPEPQPVDSTSASPRLASFRGISATAAPAEPNADETPAPDPSPAAPQPSAA